MNSTSVRKPFVSIVSPRGTVSAEGVVIRASIDSAPTVEVILRSSLSAVARPLSGEMIKVMATAQAARFQLKSGTPDTIVTIEDGNGGTLEFKGFSVAPVLQHGVASSSETVSVVGVDAFLNGLGMSIYQTRSEVSRAEDVASLFTPTPREVNGDIVAVLKKVTDVLVGNYQASYDNTGSDSLKKVLELKHEANKVALQVWYNILGKSFVQFPEWAAALEQLPEVRRALIEKTKNQMQQRTSSFWDILNSLGADFLFFYKPSMDGSAGRLSRVDVKTDRFEETAYSAGTISLSATDGNPSMLPLAGVIIYGPSPPPRRTEEANVEVADIVGAWPLQITAGFFREQTAPSWMVDGGAAAYGNFTLQATLDAATAARDTGGGKKNYDPEDYAKRAAGIEEGITAAAKEVTGLLQTYAKIVYDDAKLADSTATLDVPLDLTLQVGVRYAFDTGGGGGGKFSGFVRELRHGLQLQGGTTLAASTSLSLTHINYD